MTRAPPASGWDGTLRQPHLVEPEAPHLLQVEAALLEHRRVVVDRVQRAQTQCRRGERDDFDEVKPLLEAMGTTIHYCGPAGAGTRTKLVNNYLAIISCQLNAEALAPGTYVEPIQLEEA